MTNSLLLCFLLQRLLIYFNNFYDFFQFYPLFCVIHLCNKIFSYFKYAFQCTDAENGQFYSGGSRQLEIGATYIVLESWNVFILSKLYRNLRFLRNFGYNLKKRPSNMHRSSYTINASLQKVDFVSSWDRWACSTLIRLIWILLLRWSPSFLSWH